MSKPLTTPKGRPINVVGDASLVTMDRLDAIGRHLDTDPRIASVSIVAAPNVRSGWLRATAPSGPVVLVAADVEAIATPPQGDAQGDDVTGWARDVAERGLWHDWYLTSDVDVMKAPVVCDPSPMDVLERQNFSAAQFTLFDGANRPRPPYSLAVDATWLQEHQTGAQVLTVAAVEALANQDGICSIHLFGVDALPAYAAHLEQHPKVTVGRPDERADIAWYPNQIDGRSDIAVARDVGRRVITTYLDLIAYDIPRYHGSEDAWATYRAFQRQIALSFDGITTISADVASRLLQEVPRLDANRVCPIPLGIDHLDAHEPPREMPEEVSSASSGLGARPFVLVLGNDFRHKNRDFAVLVWEELLQRGVSCDLVLAGLHVKGSSSKEREDALLAAHVNLRGSAHRLGHVSNEARLWLLRNAAVVHYPSSAEGFGFVPYEAAALGTPSTFTDFGPLKEIAGASNLPKQWSVSEHADDLEALLTDEQRASTRTRELAQSGSKRTWNEFALELIDFFRAVSAIEPAITSTVASSSRDTAQLASILSSRTWRVATKLRKLKRT